MSYSSARILQLIALKTSGFAIAAPGNPDQEYRQDPIELFGTGSLEFAITSSAVEPRKDLKHRKRMDIAKILAELRQEREQIDEAILSLERLASGRGRGVGRPPSWMTQVSAPRRRGRPPGSKNKNRDSPSRPLSVDAVQ